MNFTSLKFKLIVSFLSIGLALALFIIIVVPSRTKSTAENVMLENVGFIVKLLSDNLAVGMQTRDLDAGAALQQTLNLIKGGLVETVAVLDGKHAFVQGLNCDKAEFSRDTIVNRENGLVIFKTMKDSDKKVLGYVEIMFSKQSFIKSINRFKIFIWLASFVALLAVVIVGTFLSNRIIMPLNKSVQMLKELASGSGDLTKRLAVTTNDEVGEMARWFNIFIEKIQKIISQIASNTSTLSSSSGALSNVAQGLSAGAGNMTDNSDAVARLTNKAVSNVNNISTAADIMSGNITQVAKSIEDMSGSLNDVTASCQKETRIAADANAQAKATYELIKGLSVSA
ncbi:MAG: methyl-accepting chemotaxis protein, partial [Chitinivibrionales bacterium]|nr:methyl-accepting chemotaxis protein [Chitinivibrionales bacterium]